MNAWTGKASVEPAWLEAVKGQVESLRFGVVQIVVHDSRVVQIDRTEKLRLDELETLAAADGAAAKGSRKPSPRGGLEA